VDDEILKPSSWARGAPQRVILSERSAPRVILSERSERKDRFPSRAVAVETAELPWRESDPFVAARLRMTNGATARLRMMNGATARLRMTNAAAARMTSYRASSLFLEAGCSNN